MHGQMALGSRPPAHSRADEAGELLVAGLVRLAAVWGREQYPHHVALSRRLVLHLSQGCQVMVLYESVGQEELASS